MLLVRADNAKFAGGDDGETEHQDGTFGNHATITMTDKEKNWDDSIMHYVPHSLRGLKPVTNEPWARDEAVYRKSDGMDEIPDDVADMNPMNFGSAADRLGVGNAFYKERLLKWDASAKPPEGAMQAYAK